MYSECIHDASVLLDIPSNDVLSDFCSSVTKEMELEMTFPWPRIDVPEKDVKKLVSRKELYEEVKEVEVTRQDDGTYLLVPKRKTDQSSDP